VGRGQTRPQGFIASVQGIANAIGPVIGLIAGAAAQFSIVGEHGRNAAGTLQTIGRFLALATAGFLALRVAHTAYNAIMAVTDALMNANPISLVVLVIAALAAGFVLAYEKIKPFHDAVDTAFILLKAPVTVAGVSVDYDVSMAGVIVRSQVAVVNMIVRGAFAQDPGRGPGRECPVGGHMRVPSDMRALARVARRQGWRIESLASGHLV
jgi:hypothetical protein